MHGPWPSSEQVALRYGRCGWHVFPLHTVDAGRCSCGDPGCRSPGKHPRTPNGEKDASTDPEQIRAGWDKWSDANIAIATGASSKLVVFEVDPQNGGDQSYEQLRKELRSAFKELSEVRTGSGGFHLYFEYAGPLPSRANIRPGINIIAEGGYVVAPPSVHATGEHYRFTSSNGFAPPPLPPALRDFILREAQAHGARQEESKARIDVESLHVSDEIKALIRDGKPNGQRGEAILAAIRAIIKVGHSDKEIIAVLVDPANRLSEKPRQKGEAWLRGEIKRAREKPDQRSGAQAPPHRNSSSLICRRASEIQPEAIRWLWPDRFALGKNSLIAGLPGLGKSQITAYLAATVSSGGTWPTGEPCDVGDVVILSAEDDPADTICPRLEACGANLDRVHIVEAVRDKRGDRFFNLKTDVAALDEKLAATPEAKLVITDPITAYLGNTDSNNNADVRGVLAPLAKLAADHGVAFVSVTHLSKGPSPDPLTRVIGSIAFIAAVRTAFLVAAAPANSERRLFLPLKSNISRACSGLAFHIEPHVLPSVIETSRVVWEAVPVNITASEALSQPTPEETADVKKIAEACLRVFDVENATELRASRLIQLLLLHEGLRLNSKQLKKSLEDCGIPEHRRSDANYYLKADFVPP